MNSSMNITEKPDPAKLMELLSQKAPEDRRKILERAAEQARKASGRCPETSREERLSRFRELRSRHYKHMNDQSMQWHVITSSWDVKPRKSSQNAVLTAIMVRELQLGTTHRGRALLGTIVEPPYFTGSSFIFMMEDLCGDLLQVAVYNIPGMSWQVGERLFYKGRQLQIAEPYFKVYMDGMHGVRVDDPDDISSCKIPQDPSAWRERGNECFKAHRFHEAQVMYSKGWEALLEARQDLAILLTNRALCCFNDGDVKACARLAGCAWHLNPAYKKAEHWLLQALKAMAQESQSSAAQVTSWPELPGLVMWERPVFRDGSLQDSNRGRGKKEVRTWQQVKEEGKALFSQGKWAEAGAKYYEAAARHEGRAELAATLGNMAAVGVEKKDWRGALQSATVAALLPPATQALAGRVWIRRARALEGLGLAHAPHSLEGVELPGVEDEQTALQKRWSDREGVTPISIKSTQEQYDEFQGAMKAMRGEGASAESVASIPTMYAVAPDSVKRSIEAEFGPLIRRQLPLFHTQFPKEYGWPVTHPADIARCRELLFSAHAHASVQPWISEHGLRKGSYTFTSGDYIHRWRTPEALQRVLAAKSLAPGTIVYVKESRGKDLKYTDLLRHSFSNNPPKKYTLRRGTVHVAVGFNDLSMLLHCELADAPSGWQGPLRFVGFEASPFSVAKCMVIAEMLRRGGGGTKEVPIQHCLQAWYSSGWSAKTSASFKACAAAVASSLGAESFTKEVQSYLLHWASAPNVLLSEARHRWLETRRDGANCYEMAQFQRHEDRMAVCAYALTGDVLGEGQRAEVGSLAMWSVPQGSPPLEDKETVLQAVDLDDLAGRGLKGDVMSEAGAMVSEQLQRIRGWLAEGALEIDLLCAFVATGTPVVDEIRALNPSTLSWSNVLDYMTPAKFHQLARDCSAQGDTVHYGFSMNWITEVFGTCIMDYEDLGDRARVIEETHKAMDMGHALRPSSRLLVHPLFETALNTTGFRLGSLHSKAWGQHFFKREYTGGEVQVGECEPAPYNPLARTYCTIALNWTYSSV